MKRLGVYLKNIVWLFYLTQNKGVESTSINLINLRYTFLEYRPLLKI